MDTTVRWHAITQEHARRTVDAWETRRLVLASTGTVGLIAADAGKAGTGPTVKTSAPGRAPAVAVACARTAGNALARGVLRASHATGASQGATGQRVTSSATGGQHARRMGIVRMTEAANATPGSKATTVTSAHRASTEKIAV